MSRIRVLSPAGGGGVKNVVQMDELNSKEPTLKCGACFRQHDHTQQEIYKTISIPFLHQDDNLMVVDARLNEGTSLLSIFSFTTKYFKNC